MAVKPKIIDGRDLKLEEWLQLVLNPPENATVVDYQFPTESLRDEYLNTIQDRSEEEIEKLLLKFLIPSGSLGIDEFNLESLLAAQKSNQTLFSKMISLQFFKRLVKFAYDQHYPPPWEGITWVIDLLPHFPKMALEALSAYEVAHFQHLPDGRVDGLFHAEEIIRARYIGTPKTQAEKIDTLLSMSSRDFEHIIERLYDAMEYETELTPPRNDGGRDVLAGKKKTAHREELRIECKQHHKPIGVEIARQLLGVVSDEKVNKGVIVTTSHFTRGAEKFAIRNPRLELIDGGHLIPLLNEHLGPTWPLHIERLTAESRRAFDAQMRQPRLKE